MQEVDAVYVRMSLMLTELGTVSKRLYDEINSLGDRLKYLGISWEGEAYDVYSRTLLSDLCLMELTACNLKLMYGLLHTALTRYQETEMRIYDMIGGMGR